MAIPQGVWGIDVGQCALKALRLEVIEGVVTATAFDYVEHPKILSQPDADPDQLTREALETFLSRNDIKGDLVAMSIAGQSGLARFVKLPPVEEKKIADIVRFEAKQQIPFPLDEVVWDYQKIGAGVVTDGFAMDTEVGLFAMKRDMINRFMHHFQAVNVEVHIVQMSPLALCNYVSYDLLRRGPDGNAADDAEIPEDTPPGKKRCAVALDIGTDGSSLIITDGQRIIWQRPIPIGGNHFTRALTKELKLTFAKAEHLKRNAAKSPDLAKILKALKPVLTDFVNEVQRSLGYFTNTHRDAHIAFMVGLGSAFRLPGLQKFLSEKLGLEVRKPNSLERLSGETVVSSPVFVENLLTFPVAYGLCLQGLKLSRLTTNLLPQEIQFDRMIRAKKPWSVAAAAAILLGVGVVSFGFGMKSQSLGHPVEPEKHPEDQIAKAVSEAGSAVKLAQSKKSEADANKNKIAGTTKEVKSIIAGKDERSNWIILNEFVSKCLPKPDCSNLIDFTKAQPPFPNNQKIYQTADSLDAARQYRQRRLGEGNIADLPLDEQALRHLVNVDIEAMYQLYVDDLKDFYTKAKDKTRKEFEDQLAGIDRFVPPSTDGQPGKKYSENFPEGPGWIVEVRGHTYHKDQRSFLLDTLVFNINKMGYGKGLVPFAAAGSTTTTTTTAAGPDAGGSAAPSFPDPIDGRVSHAFLYFVRKVDDPQPGSFVHINATQLNEVLGGGAAGGGGGFGAGGIGISGPMGPGAATPMGPMGGGGGESTPSRAGWQPIGSAGTGGGSGAGGEGPGGPAGPMGPGGFGPMGGFGGGAGPKGPMGPMGGFGGGMGPKGPMGPMGGFGGGIGPKGPMDGDSPTSARPAGRRTRYEFVVMFVWREPLGVENAK